MTVQLCRVSFLPKAGTANPSRHSGSCSQVNFYPSVHTSWSHFALLPYGTKVKQEFFNIVTQHHHNPPEAALQSLPMLFTWLELLLCSGPSLDTTSCGIFLTLPHPAAIPPQGYGYLYPQRSTVHKLRVVSPGEAPVGLDAVLAQAMWGQQGGPRTTQYSGQTGLLAQCHLWAQMSQVQLELQG